MIDIDPKEYLAPGHRACAGCGATIAVRLALKALGPNTVAVSATGCLEVVTSPYPETSWEIPWIHVAFENASAVASGVEEALKAKGLDDVNIIVIGGDGGTTDIGLQSLSGAMERGQNIIYMCYDNEAYMNTGIQRRHGFNHGRSWNTIRGNCMCIRTKRLDGQSQKGIPNQRSCIHPRITAMCNRLGI